MAWAGLELLGDILRWAYYAPYAAMVLIGLFTGGLSLRAIRKRYREEHRMPPD